MWRAFVIAIRFLTIIPIPQRWCNQRFKEKHQTLSLIFYPLVGFMLGVLLLIAYFPTALFSDLLQAALLVALWALLTGGLHLDGLADTADGWLGGHGDRFKTLRIMRDTHIGVAAVVTLVLTIIIKILLLAELQQLKIQALVLAPVIARAMALLLFTTTGYVREEGIASVLTKGLPKQRINLIVILVGVISIAVLHIYSLLMLFVVLVGFLLMRYLMIKRIGGTTGDTAGVVIEFTEIGVLLGLVLAEVIL